MGSMILNSCRIHELSNENAWNMVSTEDLINFIILTLTMHRSTSFQVHHVLL